MNTSPVWPPAGIGLIAILYFGVRLWPSILIPVFVANLVVFGSSTVDTNLPTIVSASFGIAVGSTLESVAGALLLQRFIKTKNILGRGQDVFIFIATAAASCLFSSFIGPLTLCVSGFAPWHIFTGMAFTWWMGDFSGILIVVPIFLSWYKKPLIRYSTGKLCELLASLILLSLFCMVVFFNWFLMESVQSVEYLSIPVLLWIAYRFDQRISTAVLAATLGIAIWATTHGRGPFITDSINTSLILVQGFVCVISITINLLAASISEKRKAIENLRESEERFELAMDFTKDGLFDWNLKTNEMYFSSGWKRMLGYEPDEIPNEFSEWERLSRPKDVKASWKMLEKVIAGKLPRFEKEFKMIHKNGGWVDILSRANVVTDSDGNPKRLIGTHFDITERKKYERDLQIKNWVFESSIAANSAADTTGVITHANHTFLKVWGYSNTREVIGKSIGEFLVYETEAVKITSALNQTGKWEGEYTALKKDGTTFAAYGLASNIYDSKGNKVGYQSSVLDITDRKLAEQRLEKSEQELHTVLSCSPVGLGLVVDRKLNWGNKTIYRMFGYEEDTLLGKSAQVLYPDKNEFERVGRQLYSDLQKSGTGKCEAQCIKKDGTIFYCLIQITSVDESDPGKGQIVSMIDISDLKKTEKEREKLRLQLTQAQKMESVGRLAGGVAHDFNNMLSIILGNTEILLEDLDSENPLISNLKEVKKAADHSADLTRQLLAFARKQTISPKVLNLNSTIKGMLKMLGRLIGEDIDLSWNPMDDLWHVKIDPSQVDQVLANLCVNARDAIKNVGKVTIETDNVCFNEDYCKDHPGFKIGEYVMLSVSDNGCGMDKETLKTLFEPFFTTKESGKGTGLGLATIYGIVKQNNGFINVYSEIDQGTTFRIYLQRHAEKIKEIEQLPAEGNIRQGHETILLVEDEKAILKMAKRMLERMGYTVLTTDSPTEAIQICETLETPIHLLITDVVMPSMNGRDLSERILKLYPDMKCLYMSGYTANVIAHQGILDEGLHFINKPFSKQDLSEILRTILDKTHKQKKPVGHRNGGQR